MTMTTIANTPLGILQGRVEGDCVAFRGVRYAVAPVGDLRFAPPVAVSPWDGTLDATRDGPIAHAGAVSPARCHGGFLGAAG